MYDAIPDPTPDPIPVEEYLSFYANRYIINQGECVTLRWDVEGVSEVYLDGVGVIGHDSREICPTVTITYRLMVVWASDGAVTEVPVTITVNAP